MPREVTASNYAPGESMQSKKPYVSPDLARYGKIEDLTGNVAGANNGDGGVNPNDKTS